MTRIHPTEYDWGKRRGRPWAGIDLQCALFLRHCGLTNADIAAVLRRTEHAVHGKIGYDRTRAHAVRTA